MVHWAANSNENQEVSKQVRERSALEVCHDCAILKENGPSGGSAESANSLSYLGDPRRT